MDDYKIIKLLTNLKDETVFYGTVSNINKKDNDYYVNIDLFNNVTKELDCFIINNNIKDFTYTFELCIETFNLTILGYKNELLKFEIVDDETRAYNVYDGIIWFNINKNFDEVNPFKYKKMNFKVEKASSNCKEKYMELIDYHKKDLQKKMIIEKKLDINITNKNHIKNPNVYYSQYHVGLGNCSYINIDGLTRGFFNIGFSNLLKGKSFPYYGFSRHKPDWIIISNLNINNYRAAIRYGDEKIFSSDWIMPYSLKLNVNIIRLFYGILNNDGKIYMLKYKANSSVFSLIANNVKIKMYFTSESEIGLCLYVEKDDKFISLGNSDYNFMTKSLIPQKFDILVLPSIESKMKTKVSLNKTGGFRVYRTDNKGTFKCKL